MELKNFFISLLPNFEKDRVIEDLRITKAELKDITSPAYNHAMVFMKSWKFKSPQLQGFQDSFDRLVKGQGNFIVVISKGLPSVLECLEEIESQIERTYLADVASQGLTYAKAQLLQATEAAGFVAKYARKLLDYTYISEAQQFEDSGIVMADALTPAQQEWITANFVNFCTAFSALSGQPDDLRKKLADIPDVVVTQDNLQTLPHSVGMTKIDPLKLGLIPIWMNPIYHVRMRVTEWQVSRYHAAKEDLKILQLRRLHLKQLSEGKNDVKLVNEIKYMEGRIQDLEYKIKKLEEENA